VAMSDSSENFFLLNGKYKKVFGVWAFAQQGNIIKN
jgi:hypothetical protein